MMTDPIADMLTRIRNASMARHDRTEMPYSRLKEHVARVLKSEGFVDDVRVSEAGDDKGHKQLTVVLRYGRDKQSALDGVRRVSTPGRRVYVRFGDAHVVDEAFALENTGNVHLQVRVRHFGALVSRHRGIADAGKHVRDRIGHHGVTNSP